MSNTTADVSSTCGKNMVLSRIQSNSGTNTNDKVEMGGRLSHVASIRSKTHQDINLSIVNVKQLYILHRLK